MLKSFLISKIDCNTKLTDMMFINLLMFVVDSTTMLSYLILLERRNRGVMQKTKQVVKSL